MEPVRFEEKYRQAFIDFNTDRIVTYFGKPEPHDLETFERIDDELRMRSYPYKPLFYCPHLPDKSHKIYPALSYPFVYLCRRVRYIRPVKRQHIVRDICAGLQILDS